MAVSSMGIYDEKVEMLIWEKKSEMREKRSKCSKGRTSPMMHLNHPFCA